MSYEDALEAWRREPTEPPPYSRIVRARRWGGDPQLPSAGAIAGARWGFRIAIAGFVAMALLETHVEGSNATGMDPTSIVWGDLVVHPGARTAASLLPIFLILLAETMMRQRDLARQMLVRAIGWSTLVIGVLVSVWDYPEYACTGIPIALGSGAALLFLGAGGLGITGGSFRPVAFRNQLLLALVMALADAETLLFSGIVQFGTGAAGDWELATALSEALPTLICGGIMAVAVWGIYRMRVWALLLNLIANLGIAYLALWGTLGLSLAVAGVLATTAAVQLLLPVPILAAALGDRNPDRSPLGRWGRHVLRGVIAVFMMAGAMGWVAPSTVEDGAGYLVWRMGWVERESRAVMRGLPGYRPLRSP